MEKEIRLKRVASLSVADAHDRETVCGILAKNGQWVAVEKRNRIKQDGSASKNLEFVISVAVPMDGTEDRKCGFSQ